MKYEHPELRQHLAAEYALGTLRGLARRRFERVLAADPGLRDLVQDWELRLNLLAESAPAVAPPDRVWQRIEQRLGPVRAGEALLGRWWNSLGFWRGASLLAAGAAAALAVFIVTQPPGVRPDQVAALDQRLAGIEGKLAAAEATPGKIAALDDRLARIESGTSSLANTPEQIAALTDRLSSIEDRISVSEPAPSHVASLTDKDGRPMMTADLDVVDGRLVLRLNLAPYSDTTNKALEVWSVPPDGGAPKSLGLFPSGKSGTTAVLVLTPDIIKALSSPKAALAVSLEPKGGSTTGLPTGPVLFSGNVVPVNL
jgi:anti-sigma-K factor RskA